MRKYFFCAALLALSFALPVFAQEKTEKSSPPNVIMIVREDIKAGMMPAHNKHSAAFASMFGKLQTPNHRIALVPVAGSENEVVYLTGAESFAQMEKMNKDTDKRMASVNVSMQSDLDRLEKEAPMLHAGMRDLLGILRPELGYSTPVDLPTMRYFALTTVRIRPGQEDQFIDYIKTIQNPARDKVKAELHVAVYQIIAGAPGTTFIFFRPMKSLAEYDLRIGQRVREAMTDEQKKKADKVSTEAIMATETSIYAMNPSMSYVEKEFAAADPTFWNAKPAVAAKPKPKKKTTPPSPAATGAQQ